MDTLLKTKKVMSKDEVALLVDLIQSNPSITSRETNATTNKLKEEAWTNLALIFNARSGSVPRSKEQLKLKWDNLKKAARKRSQQIRLNSLKTGGGKPDFIPPDETLEKVVGLLGATCTGFVVPFGGDGDGVGVYDSALKPLDANETVVEEIQVTGPNEEFLLHEGISMENNSEGNRAKKFKRNTLSQLNFASAEGTNSFFGPMSPQLATKRGKRKDNDGRLARNLAIAKYYNTKTEKLELEIKLLKFEIASKENCDNL